jgi:hexosaminidase
MVLKSDLRLMSVWHGSEETREIHYSLYNNGHLPIRDFMLCLTGTLWLDKAGGVTNGTIAQAQSNFIVIRPAVTELQPQGVWTFKLFGLNEFPRHAGDGTKSAFVQLADASLIEVAVQPLSRSLGPGDKALSAKGLMQGAAARRDISLSVIPFPNVASVAVSRDPGPDVPIDLAPGTEKRFVDACNRVNLLSRRVTGRTEPIFAVNSDIAFRHLHFEVAHDNRLGDEGYKLTFDGTAIHLEALTDRGYFYGLITLAQMLVGARTAAEQFGFPGRGTITDIPRFAWRGLHLDVARTYYPPEEVQAIMDVQAWLKLNVLHLHLTDDEAWRIDVPAYPRLAEVAAWRGHDLPIPPLLGSGPAAYGGTYSASTISSIEAYAAELAVTVVPEVDIPGHAHAAFTAMPELREAGDIDGYHSIQGFFGNALNPSQPQTYAFLNAVVGSVAAQFSSPWIHVGGDEIADDTWMGSPGAVALAARVGKTSTGPLQGRMIEAVHSQLLGLSRSTLVWEEALHHAELKPKRTIAMVWQHPERAQELAKRGYEVILAPGNAYYLDMASSTDWNAPGGYWAGPVPLEQTYDFEPGLNWPAHLLGKLKGVEACIWGEHMIDRRNFDALVFPRIFAYAERAWIDRTNKDLDGLLNRIAHSTVRVNRDTEAAE